MFMRIREGEEMLKFHKTKEGKKLKISLTGRLDTVGAPRLENELKPSLDGVTDLEFDILNLV